MTKWTERSWVECWRLSEMAPTNLWRQAVPHLRTSNRECSAANSGTVNQRLNEAVAAGRAKSSETWKVGNVSERAKVRRCTHNILKLFAQRNETVSKQFWNRFVSVSFSCADSLIRAQTSAVLPFLCVKPSAVRGLVISSTSTFLNNDKLRLTIIQTDLGPISLTAFQTHNTVSRFKSHSHECTLSQINFWTIFFSITYSTPPYSDSIVVYVHTRFTVFCVTLILTVRLSSWTT